jgi:hypothetical protein
MKQNELSLDPQKVCQKACYLTLTVAPHCPLQQSRAWPLARSAARS